MFQRLCLSDMIFQQGGWRHNIFAWIVSFTCFFNRLRNVWFQQVHNMLRLCMFQRFPRMIAAWGWFSDLMHFWLIFHILWHFWFGQVHQTSRLCRIDFRVARRASGPLFEAMFTKRYACACYSVSDPSANQVQADPKGYLNGYPRIRSYLSICLSINLSTYVSIYLSIYLSI